LHKNASGNRLPYLDEIAFLIVPTEDAAVIRFQAGDIDVISRIGAGNYDALERDQRVKRISSTICRLDSNTTSSSLT
jgi:ABC-type transport system substrate-binding protein